MLRIEIVLTVREQELLVAAKSDKPAPGRIKSLLLADAARVLRGMIDVVTQERNQRFADKGLVLAAREARKLNAPLVLKRSAAKRKPTASDHSANGTIE
jgi:hypothetical protein